MNKIIKGIGIILSLLAVYIFLNGVKYTFQKEKGYVGYGEDIYHSTKFCPRLDINEMDMEYMDETGKLLGSEEYSELELYNDLALQMCPYCFSRLEIDSRNKHFKEGYKERYDEKVKEAKKKREERKLKELNERYEKFIKKGRD